MKLDNSAIRDPPENDTNISSENAVIEADEFEKVVYMNKAELVNNSESFEQEVERIENGVHSLNLDTIEEDEENSNHVRDTKMSMSQTKQDVDRALKLIDAELAADSHAKQYNDIFTVNFSYQNISSIEESLSEKLNNLVVLDLSHNKLSHLPDLLDFKCLKQLDISHNEFESVPVCLQIFCSKLVNLNMSHNHLKTFDQPMCTHTLRKLAIDHNIGMKIPEWFWYQEFYCLEELDISFTDPFCQWLPIWLLNHMEAKERGVFTNLTSLDMRNTQAFNHNIAQLKHLKRIKFLNCSNEMNVRSDSVNVFWELPASIPHLISVQELRLSCVHLNHIPEEIGNLVCLEVLNLSHNRIIRLPESVASLKRLKVLDVSYNGLVTLPERFADLAQLSTLHAQSNELSELPARFQALSLVHCDLYKNELGGKCVPVLREMKRLQSLDVMQNYVKQDLLPLDLQENLRATLDHPEDRLNEPKRQHDSDAFPEETYDPHTCTRCEAYSGYASLSSSRSTSPVLGSSPRTPSQQAAASTEDMDESNWDDEATNSDEFNFCIVDEWQKLLPKSYDEAIERFRTRRPSDTTFIPGDTQVKYFKRKEMRRFNFLSRPVVPGQFDDA